VSERGPSGPAPQAPRAGNVNPFTHRIRVRYAEIDGQGVVFNAHWLTYFDETCTRFMGSLGFDEGFWVHEFDVMLVKAVLEWSGPAEFDDWIDIQVAPVRLGNKSFDLEFTATVEGRLACAATITYVAVVPGRNTSVALSDDVRDALTLRLV
jgi:acyl-CoA thioester hydrolase